MKQFSYSSGELPSDILSQFYSWCNRHGLLSETDTEVSILNTETNEAFTNTIYNQIMELKEAIRES